MKPEDIVRAWKDEDYRQSLSAHDRALLPENPAGIVELPDEVLVGAAGGTDEVVAEEPLMAFTSLPCFGITIVTALACQSLIHGSCAVYGSYGCCPW